MTCMYISPAAECPADKVYLPCGPVDPPTCKDKCVFISN